ncbi:hypothetical protein EAO70_27995 [Streptomyces sp. adm13(2018)]|uniref:hypothetical protein n=1 Tax=Streptomyces sp. adm13(2018) TaxID=2479007 RepID=UPI0011CED1FA|nr:hypothetical protein [Streptomyces sp. adm13(2018)]TXS12181.1 hypothetical protein EAO70_27995 [Streptomyces sp. adm13(2018)]
MSDHLIEDLVADSVRVLDQHGQGDDSGLRDQIAVLYAFERGYDCSFTKFRVMDTLLRCGYTYRFPMDRHPDYAERAAYFDALTEFTGLRAYDEDAPDFDGYQSWLEDGYVQPPLLYCDAGTGLWQRMVDIGELQGPDSAPLRPVPLIDVVRDVAVAAEKEEDRDLIALWYSFGCENLLGGPAGCPFGIDEVAAMASVQELHAVVRRTDTLALAGRSPYAAPVEFADVEDLETWWWRHPGRGTAGPL